jgi:hypothetical protein
MKYSCFAELYCGHTLNLSFHCCAEVFWDWNEEVVLTPFSGSNVICCRCFVYEKKTYGKAHAHMFPIRMNFFPLSVFVSSVKNASDVSRPNCVAMLRSQVLHGRQSIAQRYVNTILLRKACDIILSSILSVIPEEYYATGKCEIK